MQEHQASIATHIFPEHLGSSNYLAYNFLINLHLVEGTVLFDPLNVTKD